MNWLSRLPFARRIATVSAALYVVACVVLLIVAAAAVLHLHASRAAIIANAEQQLTRLDMVFAEQTGRAVETVDLLVSSAQEMAAIHLMQSLPMDDVDDVLQRRVRGVRQLAYLLVVDAAGKVVASSGINQQSAPIPVIRALLDRYRTNPQAGLLITPPFHVMDGTWNVLVARPILAPDGSLIGVAAGAINLAYFEDFYRAVELNDEGAIVLHLRDGTVLARFPHIDAAIGSSFAGTPPFVQVLAHHLAGTVLMVSPIDGHTRLTAIRALRAFPLAVMVSVEMEPLLAGWWRDAVALVIVALALSGLVVGLILLLARRSRQVERFLEQARTARNVAEQTKERLQQQIAERERAEGALRQAQRIEAIGQLTGGVAHDFNNLLTVVLGNVDILQRRLANGALDDALASQLAAIRSAAERGAMLTRHMLAFARRQPLMPKPVALNAAITGMRDLLESALGKKARLDFRLADDLWPAMVDQSQIELVILNLVINARDAIVDTRSDRGLVTVETRNHRRQETGEPDGPPSGDYVRIIVRDNGTGMSPEVLGRVFEPFFTTKPPGVGSGLGLSQVFGTARQSGGGVRIESEVGNGTAVIVDLPRAAPRPLEAPTPRVIHGDLDVTVLLVESDDAERNRTSAMLREIGCKVRQAIDGDAALAVLGENRGIDVLLTDLMILGSDGGLLAAAARSVCPDIVVVFMTFYADQGIERVTDGAPILRKPFNSGALFRALAAGLARRLAVAEQAAGEPAGG